MHDAWDSIEIPKDIKTFFSFLFGWNLEENGDQDDQDNRGESDVEDRDEIGDNDDASHSDELVCSKISTSIKKKQKALSLYQILYFLLHNGRRRTPLHMMGAEAIHSACKSKTLITSFNHFGLTMSYDELMRYHNDMASYVVESHGENIPLPCHFDPTIMTSAAIDNFDHEEGTLSGVAGSHDTVSILVQDKPKQKQQKPLRSETTVQHGSKTFKHHLPCQEIQDYIPPSKKADLPDDYTVEKDLVEMETLAIKMNKAKDTAWLLTRLSINLDSGEVHDICEHQKMPAWAGFNSVITEEKLDQRQVGFLPVLPSPVTKANTVYTALKNIQGVLKPLKQNAIAVTCDEGVYHIAREIQLNRPYEFSNIVLCLGSFHMIKIVLGCMGKYVEGSGVETALVENEIFGENVVKSVIAGSHYVRSLTGMMLLSEVINAMLHLL